MTMAMRSLLCSRILKLPRTHGLSWRFSYVAPDAHSRSLSMQELAEALRIPEGMMPKPDMVHPTTEGI